MAAFFAALTLPLQTSAAGPEQRDLRLLAAAPQADAPLAEREIRRFREAGLHCRSSFDGSSASAVQAVRQNTPAGSTFVLLETALWPEDRGRHELVMVFALVGRDSRQQVHRVYGWVDHDSCEARIEGELRV